MMANNRLFNVFIFIVALILGCGLVSYKVTQSRNEENQHVKYLVKLFSLKGNRIILGELIEYIVICIQDSPMLFHLLCMQPTSRQAR